MSDVPADVTILILAGGQATRFPGKLEQPVDGVPLLARVYRNLRDAAPVVIAARNAFSPKLHELLECPIVLDRWPGRGPLAAILSALSAIDSPRLFVAAGDAPNLSRDLFSALLGAWRDGDEAVIPEHDGKLEPLAGLYARGAIAREAPEVLLSGDASMHGLLGRLTVRRLALSPHYFVNVNRPQDLTQVQGVP
jgi:molybdenum cofactor guanylyltransferase